MSPNELAVFKELRDWYAQTCADPKVDSLLAEADAILATECSLSSLPSMSTPEMMPLTSDHARPS